MIWSAPHDNWLIKTMKLKSLLKTVNWKKIETKLIFENCLTFGHEPKLTTKKISKYLLGTRIKTELFKLYELRSLLLKVYPLIHNLFYNPRFNFKFEKPDFKMQPKKQYKFRPALNLKRKHLTPQILFATITPAFSHIVQSAAQICNMPVHQNRWLCGSITAAIAYPSDQNLWNYVYDPTQNHIFEIVTQTWGANKEDREHIKEKISYYGSSRWPSLLIIPDISNNEMIIKEAKTVNLPILGLVNSHCQIEIDYPIFAQDQTSASIYFFCHFLGGLIAKEMIYFQHKRFTIQKIKRQILQKKETLFTTKHIVKKESNEKKQPDNTKDNRKNFFFKHVYPGQKQRHIKPFWQKELSNVVIKLWFSLKEKKKKNRKRQKLRQKSYKKSDSWLINWKTYDIRPTSSVKMKYNQWYNFQVSYQRKIIHKIRGDLQRVAQKIIIPLNTFGKYLLFLQQWTRAKRAVNITHQETKKLLTRFQTNNTWTFEEKKLAWESVQNFLHIEKRIELQKREPDYRFNLRFSKKNNNYYWWSLQHWIQDLNWQNHKNLLKYYLRRPFNSPLKRSTLQNNKFYKKKQKNSWSKRAWHAWKTKIDAPDTLNWKSNDFSRKKTDFNSKF